MVFLVIIFFTAANLGPLPFAFPISSQTLAPEATSRSPRQAAGDGGGGGGGGACCLMVLERSAEEKGCSGFRLRKGRRRLLGGLALVSYELGPLLPSTAQGVEFDLLGLVARRLGR